MTPRKRTHRDQPARCKCQPSADTPREHGKPGAHAADHGDPWKHVAGCIHSDLQHTTKPAPKVRTVNRLRLQ